MKFKDRIVPKFVENLIQKRFLSNSIISVVDQFFGLFLGLFITIMLARYFGPATLGNYTLALSLTSLVSVGTNFGIQTSVKRSVARDNAITGFQIGQAFIIRSLISLPCSIVLVHILAQVMKFNYELILLCHFVNLWVFASGLFALISAVLVSLHLNRILLVLNILYRLTNLALLSLVVYFEESLELYMVFVTLITLVVCFYSVRVVTNATQSVSWRPDWHFIYKLVITSAPLMLAAAVEFANLKIDSLILGYYQSAKEVGFYAAGFNIALAFTMVPLAVTKVFFPNFIDGFYNDNKRKAARLFINIFILFLIYGLVSASLLCIYSDVPIGILFGDDYERTASVLVFLAISIPIIVLNRLTNYMLIALNLDRRFFFITLLGLIINIILNILLIPEYSIYGAAIATIGCELIVLILGLQNLYNKLRNELNV